MFCLAWVTTVGAQVARFARPEEAAISAYLKRQYASMKELQLRHRVADKRVDEYLLRDFDFGQRAEAEVRLQDGVGAERSHLMLESAR
jgi:hypothetical protein